MSHSLLVPEITPAKGEVSCSEASSIAWCTLLFLVPDVAGDRVVDVLTVIACVWWLDALLDWSYTKIANDAITITQIAIDASRNNPTMEETTPLD